MDTPFLPVTCQCPTCKRFFVEWFAATDCEGKTKSWRPKLRCNHCFVNRAAPEHRSHLAASFDQRSKEMFARFPNADLRHCDRVHTEQIEAKRFSYTDCIPRDNLSPRHKSDYSTD